MNDRLIVFVDAHWPQPLQAEWVALDARGGVAASGCSEPQHWPPAERCIAVLGSAQCVWLEVELPPAPRREQSRLIAYALEEKLLRDPENQHLTVTHARDAGEGAGRLHGVLAASRARLRQITAAFEALGRPLDGMWSGLQSLPAMTQGWTLSFAPDGAGVLRTGLTGAWEIDASPEAPDAFVEMLGIVIDALRMDAAVPAVIALHAPSGPRQPALDGLEMRLGMRLEAAPAAEWWSPPARPAELLHGEFAPRGQRASVWRRLRAPAVVAVIAAALWSVVALAGVITMRSEQAMLTQRMERLLADVLPGTPAVAPEQQLRRVVDAARHDHGQLAGNDLLTLLAAHVEAGGGTPAALEYAEGRLRLELSANPPPALAERLAVTGLEARAEGRRAVLEAAR